MITKELQATLLAALSEARKRRHVNRSAERAAVSEADIIEEHDNDVRRAGWCGDAERRRRYGVAGVEGFDCLHFGLGDREDRAVERTRVCARAL